NRADRARTLQPEHRRRTRRRRVVALTLQHIRTIHPRRHHIDHNLTGSRNRIRHLGQRKRLDPSRITNHHSTHTPHRTRRRRHAASAAPPRSSTTRPYADSHPPVRGFPPARTRIPTRPYADSHPL